MTRSLRILMLPLALALSLTQISGARAQDRDRDHHKTPPKKTEPRKDERRPVAVHDEHRASGPRVVRMEERGHIREFAPGRRPVVFLAPPRERIIIGSRWFYPGCGWGAVAGFGFGGVRFTFGVGSPAWCYGALPYGQIQYLQSYVLPGEQVVTSDGQIATVVNADDFAATAWVRFANAPGAPPAPLSYDSIGRPVGGADGVNVNDPATSTAHPEYGTGTVEVVFTNGWVKVSFVGAGVHLLRFEDLGITGGSCTQANPCVDAPNAAAAPAPCSEANPCQN